MGGPLAAVAFKALEYGVTELSKGDVKLRTPPQVGVKAELKEEARAFLPRSKPVTKTIFNYRSWTGWWDHYSSVDQDGDGRAKLRSDTPGFLGDSEIVENVNIKLQCTVQYNGPEVWASFDMAPSGRRSRLGSDTTIDISPQLDLDFSEAPEAWKKVGLKKFPVIYLPVSIVVDELGLNDNFKAAFKLVLSGMYGFGESSAGDFQIDYAEHSD